MSVLITTHFRPVENIRGFSRETVIEITCNIESQECRRCEIIDLTDHLPNFLIFDKFTSLPSNMKLYKRDYSTLNYEKLVNDVQIINWSEVLVSELGSSWVLPCFIYFMTKSLL